MANYDNFSEYYDKVMWKPTKLAHWIKEIAEKNNPDAKSILELACGTGNLLELLKDDFEIAGLDLSEGMLKKARDKMPNAEFFKADMTNFQLNRKFDIVACIFDSINHVKGLENWGKVFMKAAEHLSDKGLFVFDYNTIVKLEKLSKSEGHTDKFEDKEMQMKIDKKDGAYVFNAKIVKNNELLMEDWIGEYAYPTDQIISEAKKYFKSLEVFDNDMESKPTESSWRVYVGCKK